MTREQKIREARRLRKLGWTAPAIGQELGVSDSTVRNWCLGGTCLDCGAFVDGSNGTKSERCSPCRHAWEVAHKTWTREAILDAIRRWAAQYGTPPFATDWLRANPEEGFPCFGSVFRSTSHPGAPFATWNDAIRAAGFPPREIGRYPRDGLQGLGRVQQATLTLLRDANHPLPGGYIARRLGCRPNSAWYALNALIRRGLVGKVSRGKYAALRNENRLAA